MAGEAKLVDFFLDNLKKFFYPEELIDIDLELSKTELLAMFIVARHGEVIMSQIADYLNLPLSTATGLVNRLVKSGYVRRERSEADRRIVAIKLTQEGRELVEKVKDTINGYVDRIERLLSAEERETLLRLFIKVIEALKRENSELNANKPDSSIKTIEIE